MGEREFETATGLRRAPMRRPLRALARTRARRRAGVWAALRAAIAACSTSVSAQVAARWDLNPDLVMKLSWGLLDIDLADRMEPSSQDVFRVELSWKL